MNIRVFARKIDSPHEYTYRDVFGLREIHINFDNNSVQAKDQNGVNMNFELSQLYPPDLPSTEISNYLFPYDTAIPSASVSESPIDVNKVKKDKERA